MRLCEFPGVPSDSLPRFAAALSSFAFLTRPNPVFEGPLPEEYGLEAWKISAQPSVSEAHLAERNV